MHQVLFSLKRTHLKSLAMCRNAIAFGSHPLTPARYDMLSAARKHANPHFTQSALRKLLGVNRATTSRMARSLEKLGYIERAVYPYDRRQLLFRLTAEGTRILELVEYDVVTSGIIDFGVTHAFAVKWYSENAICELLNFEDRLFYARGQLHDRAEFFYDWRPDN